MRCVRPRVRGFSLLEVVVAIGVFALGMTAVIGLFAPAAKAVAGTAEAEAATHLGEALRTELTRRVRVAGSFAGVTTLLKESDGQGGHALTSTDANPNLPANDPRRDPQLLFASRDGLTFGPYDDPVWGGIDTGKFFEIALIRNETLSPAANDDGAMLLVYTARIRFPAFVPDATPTNPRRALPNGFNATAAVRFDHSRKQVLFLAGSVIR